MDELLGGHEEKLVVGVAMVASMLAVAVYVIRKVRTAPIQHERPANEMLSKCRESHSRGQLSDAEFRTIKTTLEARLQEELKDDGKRG